MSLGNIEAACRQIGREAALHPEYDGLQPPEYSSQQRADGSRIDEITVRFEKYGKDIMAVPVHLDDGDYDWPEITPQGYLYLEGLAEQAAERHGIAIDHKTAVHVANHEKGWVSVGYIQHAR